MVPAIRTFGTEGKVVQELAEISAISWSMALQPDGKIVVAGSHQSWGTGPSNEFALARYNPDGSRDWWNQRLGVRGRTAVRH